MFKNYLTSVWRYISRNKAFTTINILGLVIGMIAFILIGQYVVHELSYDRFWKDYSRVYRLQLDRYNTEGALETQWAAGAAGIGPDLQAAFPEIEHHVRMRYAASLLSKGDIFFQEEGVMFTSKDFFRVFGYPLIAGVDSTCLTGLNRIVISESLAKKYFGNEDPLGKTMRSNGRTDYEVTGVFKDLPENSHMKINALLSLATFGKAIGQDEEKITTWDWDGWLTYIKVKPHVDAKALEAKLPAFVFDKKGDKLNPKRVSMVFHLQALNDIHLDSDFMMEMRANGSRDTTYFLTVIAILIIIIAWINYINLSTAKSIERAREVGVRKVMGGYRFQLVQQFLSEAVFLNTLAVLVAIGAVILLTPWFSELTGRQLGYGLLREPLFWIFIAVLIAVGSLLSGLYPAFVLSSFKPVDVLKGRFRNTSRGALLRKGMVVVQFVASITLIAGTYTVYQQISFMRKQNLGVSINQTLVIHTPAVTDSTYVSKYEVFKETLLKYPEIEYISSATAVPGRQPDWNAGGIRRLSQRQEESKQYRIIMMDQDYVDSYGLKVVAGRSFKSDVPNEWRNVLLNESAARLMGFTDFEQSVNDQIFFWGDTFRIVGVLKNYHQESLKKAVEPLIYRYNDAPGGYYSVKMSVADATASIQKIEEVWKEFYPGSPFNYFFLDDYYNEQYKADQQFGNAFGVLSGLAIFIACLGLFGLSSLMAIQRTKEIGVRKVLGASVSSILTLVGKDLLLLIVVAVLIATPITWYVMTQWLDSFATKVGLSVLTFALPCFGVLLIAAITISIHTMKAARANPVNSLRYE